MSIKIVWFDVETFERRKRKRVCVVLFFLSCCCKAFLCLVDIDVLSSFSRVMFPNRSTWRTTFTVLHLARTTKNFVVRRYRVSVESPAVDLPVDDSLSPLFNIFLITVKIDFQSCLPQQLVLSWGVLSLSYVHTYAIVVTDSKIFFCFSSCRFHRASSCLDTKSSNGIIAILFEASAKDFNINCAENCKNKLRAVVLK